MILSPTWYHPTKLTTPDSMEQVSSFENIDFPQLGLPKGVLTGQRIGALIFFLPGSGSSGKVLRQGSLGLPGWFLAASRIDLESIENQTSISHILTID